MHRLVVLPAARDDLLEIGDFIAQDNPRRAASYISELEQGFPYQIPSKYR
ncbi:type II toxin-antitoxin system RelE/ParE family toxin (plasmid) [Thalassobaculum sp. OXR-137]|nr:type II toxin-antitoxin system RelE/ParE family toxin [Thalassobaculum sp. OXR-137]WPZ37204.1 type II toxin-antitoxin system RelE/ParE family toxin [Thalassobaculum sp. OXR-137]